MPSELNQFAKDHGATHGGFVPAVLDLFAEVGAGEMCRPCCVDGLGTGMIALTMPQRKNCRNKSE